MKKLSILAATFAAIVFASCGNKTAQNAESADSVVKSFEQEQIEASIKMHVDSLASEIGKLKMVPFLQADGNGGIQLTKELLSALDVDKRVAKLYEMPTEDYDKAITKLAADINDPSFKVLDNEDNASVSETTQKLYEEMEKNGRLNYFWQIAAASLIEQLYLANQNADKYLSTCTDEAAANTTFRVVLILDALNRLGQYDPEIQPVSEALAPLSVLNATTVAELKAQIAEAKDKIIAAREALVK